MLWNSSQIEVDKMGLANTIMIIVVASVTLLGIATLFYPNLAKLINAPGGPRIKAIVAIITGIIVLIAGLIFQISG